MRVVCFILSLLPLIGVVQAQETAPAWEVVVYVSPEIGISVLTPDGEAERIPVPDIVAEHTYVSSMTLSQDRRWLAFSGSLDQGDYGIVYLADLEEDTCCTIFDNTYELPDGFAGSSFEMIGMHPDHSQMVLLYSHCSDESGCDALIQGLLLVDLVSKNAVILGSFDLSYWQTVEYGYVSGPVAWQEEGFAFNDRFPCLPGQMCVDLFVLSSRRVRDLDTGETLSTTPIVLENYTVDPGDQLELTGEYISEYIFHAEEAPEGEEVRAIIYYAPEMDAALWRQNPTRIYSAYRLLYDDWNVWTTRWVADGNAVLIKKSADIGRAVLLMRDGSEQTLDVPCYHEFLVGTPDGWLMYESLDGGDPTPEVRSLFHYRYENGKVTTSELAGFEQWKRYSPDVLQATPLGASVTQPFTEAPLLPPSLG